MMKATLLALAFLLELALLVVAGWWGFTRPAGWPVRVAAGLGAPLLIAVVWGLFCSPKAGVPLPAPAKLTVQAACFVTGGLLLALAGRPVPGALLVAVWAVDKALLTLAGDPV
ncbi:YrdB family protein [Micromonospora sp. NPDC007271]|uniref:YrdB family protein n=1 Tax=Micromonospora sp. NPDC007271 TaxID=3154587 RepID=UPI0033C09815